MGICRREITLYKCTTNFNLYVRIKVFKVFATNKWWKIYNTDWLDKLIDWCFFFYVPSWIFHSNWNWINPNKHKLSITVSIELDPVDISFYCRQFCRILYHGGDFKNVWSLLCGVPKDIQDDGINTLHGLLRPDCCYELKW